ncbi:MAG TPA: hypothetical protein VJ783_24515 [Pirellulales bacterium]|nr:hypothetical protein [Pirellulales bacterium]
MSSAGRYHVRWVRLAAPLLGSVLLTGCGSESNDRPLRRDASRADAPPAETLQPCGDPSLQPLEPVNSTTTVAVQYPAAELQHPTRLARPFPLTDPRSPLPFITIPRPAIRDVRAAPPDGTHRIEPLPPVDAPLAVEPLPPIETPHDIEPLPDVEPLPEIEALPEVGPLPDVELPDELPTDEGSAAPSQPELTPPAIAENDAPVPDEDDRQRAPFRSAEGDLGLAPPGNAAERNTFPVMRQAPVVAPAPVAVTPPDSGTVRSVFPTGVKPVSPDPRPLAPGPSSASMAAVARQAQHMIQHGYELGGRGALYSARAEFIAALRTTVQALDVQAGGRAHSDALSAGLKALDEAEHFVPQGSRLESDLDIGALVRAHRTPVCKRLPEDQLLPVLVLQRYYTYAHEQLTTAGHGEEAASMALFGLGKTYTALADQHSPAIVAAEPKAMVFHQAALATDPGNFLAANELAVLAAHYGEYATSRALLQYSIAILPHSSVWKNLAAVHKRLGEEQLAQAAEREAVAAARREALAKQGNREGIIPSSEITWVDPATFAGLGRQTAEWHKPAAMNTTDAKAAEPAPVPDRSARKGWSGWWR